jgi:hypothetical protein
MEKRNHPTEYESQLNRLFKDRQLNRKGVLVSKTEVEDVPKTVETGLEKKPESARINNLSDFLNKNGDITVAEAMGIKEASKKISTVLYIGPNNSK